MRLLGDIVVHQSSLLLCTCFHFNETYRSSMSNFLVHGYLASLKI